MNIKKVNIILATQFAKGRTENETNLWDAHTGWCYYCNKEYGLNERGYNGSNYTNYVSDGDTIYNLEKNDKLRNLFEDVIKNGSNGLQTYDDEEGIIYSLTFFQPE